MRRFDILLSTLVLVLLPTAGVAQSDLCNPPRGAEREAAARAEQLRIEAAERAQRDAERRSWDVKMFTVKNPLSDDTLRALCIFRIEVVNQPALRLVQIRAPKELMTAIEDAVRRLDVPPVSPPVPKGIELTGYVVVAMDTLDPQMTPLPSVLQPVANELKSILPNGSLALADTFVVRGLDRQELSVSGNTSFRARASVYDRGSAPVIRLDSLNVVTRDASNDNSGASFQTSVDVPVGTQVVIGKGTPNRQGRIKAVILVINAKLLN